MRLLAHVRADGSIEGLLAMPAGDVTAGLLPDDPGVQVHEIEEHELKGERVDAEALARLHDQFKVEVTSSKAAFVRRDERASY